MRKSMGFIPLSVLLLQLFVLLAIKRWSHDNQCNHLRTSCWHCLISARIHTRARQHMRSYIIRMLMYMLHLYKILLKCSYCLSSGIIVVALVAHSFYPPASEVPHVHYFKRLVVFRCSSNWEPIVTNSYVTRTRFQLMRTNEYKASHMRTNAYNWVSNDKQTLAFLIRSLACNFR